MAAGHLRRAHCFAFTLSFKGIVAPVWHCFFCVSCQEQIWVSGLSTVFHKIKLQSCSHTTTTTTKAANGKTLSPLFCFVLISETPQFKKFLFWCISIWFAQWEFMAIYWIYWDFILAVNDTFILNIEPCHFIVSSHFGTLYKLIRLIIEWIFCLFVCFCVNKVRTPPTVEREVIVI